MKTIFVLLTGLVASSAYAINPPAELKAIGDKAHVCFQDAAQIFVGAVTEQHLNLTETVIYDGGKIGHRVEATGAGRCRVSVSTEVLNMTFTSCGLSESHDHLYVDHGYMCRPPAIRYNLVTVNDGYDRVGNPINERRALDKAWFDAGSCADQDLKLRNSMTNKETPFVVNFKALGACLEAATL